jgi:hypothetical protein
MGGQLTEFMLLLNDEVHSSCCFTISLIIFAQEAVAAFSGRGNLSLGAELGVAAGPVGRAASATVHADGDSFPPVYSYSHSKGLFAGMSLEGSVISMRDDCNEAFYGKKVTAKELLDGTIPAPTEAADLYKQLDPVNMAASATDEDSIVGQLASGMQSISAMMSSSSTEVDKDQKAEAAESSVAGNPKGDGTSAAGPVESTFDQLASGFTSMTAGLTSSNTTEAKAVETETETETDGKTDQKAAATPMLDGAGGGKKEEESTLDQLQQSMSSMTDGIFGANTSTSTKDDAEKPGGLKRL